MNTAKTARKAAYDATRDSNDALTEALEKARAIINKLSDMSLLETGIEMMVQL